MTLATLFLALIATPAAADPGEPMLLDFQAEWCGPCKQMRPAVEKLVGMGYPIKAVDVDRSPQLAARYEVEQVPTFIVVDGAGKVLARTSGAQPAAQLATFFNEAVTKAGSRKGDGPAPADSEESDPAPEAVEAPGPAEPAEADEPAARPAANPKPWETVVRIKMHLSDREMGMGSGTIIHSTADEAIILTCAHIFKLEGRKQPTPGEFNVKIGVDLFDGQLHGPQGQTVHCTQRDLPGEAIDYNFTTDVGLIRIRPGRRLPASRVVPAHWQPKRGHQMYAVGCSHGADATAWSTQILDPRVAMSNPKNQQSFTVMKCAGQPRQGRSGGGLYTTDGYVAGVCDFAMPSESVGLYATPESIHAMLDRNKLTALYRPAGNQPDRLLASNKGKRGPSSSGTIARAQSPSEPEAARPGPITLPPPALAGVKMPKPDGWAAAAATPSASLARNIRRPGPAPRVNEDDVPVTGNTAITTDLPTEPTDEDRLLEDLGPPPEPKRTAPARSPGTSKWTRSTRPLPGFDQPFPPARP